jgi:hypothetical protein
MEELNWSLDNGVGHHKPRALVAEPTETVNVFLEEHPCGSSIRERKGSSITPFITNALIILCVVITFFTWSKMM